MSSDSKSIVAKLNKGEKLNGGNYDIWHCKIQYVLEEQEALEDFTYDFFIRYAHTVYN